MWKPQQKQFEAQGDPTPPEHSPPLGLAMNRQWKGWSLELACLAYYSVESIQLAGILPPHSLLICYHCNVAHNVAIIINTIKSNIL